MIGLMENKRKHLRGIQNCKTCFLHSKTIKNTEQLFKEPNEENQVCDGTRVRYLIISIGS